MTISEVIRILQEQLDINGDLPVFVNGEHGAEDMELSNSSHISVGAAINSLDPDINEMGDVQPFDAIMTIGGY